MKKRCGFKLLPKFFIPLDHALEEYWPWLVTIISTTIVIVMPFWLLYATVPLQSLLDLLFFPFLGPNHLLLSWQVSVMTYTELLHLAGTLKRETTIPLTWQSLWLPIFLLALTSSKYIKNEFLMALTTKKWSSQRE